MVYPINPSSVVFIVLSEEALLPFFLFVFPLLLLLIVFVWILAFIIFLLFLLLVVIVFELLFLHFFDAFHLVLLLKVSVVSCVDHQQMRLALCLFVLQ